MQNKSKILIWLAAVMAVLLIGVVVWSILRSNDYKGQVESANAQNAELKLENEQLQLENEFSAVDAEFQTYEGHAQRIGNDTIAAKYNAAKAKIEQLLQELNNEKGKNKKKVAELQGQINDLRGQIATLKALLRNYIAQVDTLSKENAGLKAEVSEVRQNNAQLSQRVASETQRADALNERMTLAEKLNVTGVGLQALNKKGKNEKNVTKAKQLLVTFTIPQNNSTPVGNKTFYLRLVNPEGQLLGNSGSFSMDGGNVTCTARKNVEYQGDEVAGIHIYWDVNTTLTPGDYTVELFTDGYRLCSKHFNLKK